MNGEIILSSKRKWLWVGIILLIITPPLSVLIFAIALLILEKKYRKVALVIIALSVVLYIIYFSINSFGKSLKDRALQNPPFNSNVTSVTSMTKEVLLNEKVPTGTKPALPVRKTK